MPPADNTPDFDKMSPEEIMRWMESLAVRQGANEGFTTSADMEVADIDPDSVVIDEPGYVPSEGKSKGKPIVSVTRPVTAKPASPAAQTPPPPAPKPEPVKPVAPPPVPVQPAAAVPAKPAAASAPPPASATPDFSTMSPDEMMKWMESLAKRQGVDAEQLTTDADMAVAEVDPSTYVEDGPGYKPPEGSKAAKILAAGGSLSPAPKPVTPKPPQPVTAAQPPAPAKPTPPPPQPAKPVEPPAPKPVEPSPMGMSWLEEMAADQGADFPDLSSLGAELALGNAPAQPAPAASNPIDWLGSLTDAGSDAPDLSFLGIDASEVTNPLTTGEDPVNWLESLAKVEGVNNEELLTDANLSIPALDSSPTDGPGYTPYSFDAPNFTPKQPELNLPPAGSLQPAKTSEPEAVEDPAAWLDQLASAQGFGSGGLKPVESKPKQLSDTEIQTALARGESVPHDQMEAWMSRQLEIGSQREEPPELSGDYDPNAPAVPAELPDWLLDQVGQPPALDEAPPPAQPVAEKPPLVDDILPPPAVQDMPDWLKADLQPHSDLDSIFAMTPDEETQPFTPPAPAAPPPAAPVVPAAPSLKLETSDKIDPWVEAFDEEFQQRAGGIQPQSPVPVAQPAAPAASVLALADAALGAETELSAGEVEPVPDWLSGIVSGDEADTATSEPLPDWLQAASPEPSTMPVVSAESSDWFEGIETNEVPDWLRETLGTEEQPAVSLPPAVVVQQPVAAPAAIVPVRPPAPVSIQAMNIDAAAVLASARSKATENDLNGSLSDYETLVRASAEVESVVDDLTKMTEKVKNSATLYRVLGDGLMRQGQLQAALETYRKALNQL
jgi:hypothetical protein